MTAEGLELETTAAERAKWLEMNALVDDRIGLGAGPMTRLCRDIDRLITALEERSRDHHDEAAMNESRNERLPRVHLGTYWESCQAEPCISDRGKVKG